MNPFVIVFKGQEFTGWLDATLERKRDQMTAALEFSVFYSEMPSSPVLTDMMPGADIQAYVGGQLAFNGTIDNRGGQSVKLDKNGRAHDASGRFVSKSEAGGGGTKSVSISKDAYRIVFSCRGKCKRLADSSHNHKTGHMDKGKPVDAIKALLTGHQIDVIDEANLDDDIPRWFSDGGIIADEIHRILKFSGASVFETLRGELKIASHGESGNGDDLILGQNILGFSANITEEFQRSIITIKGARTDASYGRKAIVDPYTQLEVRSVKTFAPYIGQLDGDATQDRLKRAAKNEASARAQMAKQISIEVFHVQSQSGQPWDINITHYVEVPTENIFDEFVTTSVRYECDGAGERLLTHLQLSPKSSVDEDGTGDSANSDNAAKGATRRAQQKIDTKSPWNDTVSFTTGINYTSPANAGALNPGPASYPRMKIG